MPASKLAVATFALLGLLATALLASGLLSGLGTRARVTGGHGSLAEFFFDAEEAVVLAHAVRTREGTRLDLASGSTDSEVSNEGVFGFARAVRNDRSVAFVLGALDGGESFGHGTDLVHLDEDGVGDAGLDAFVEDGRVGNEQVVTHEVDLATELVGHDLPASPVSFVETVFNREDGVLVDELFVELDHVGRLDSLLGALLEGVGFRLALLGVLVAEFRRSNVESDLDVGTELVTGLFSSGLEGGESLFEGHHVLDFVTELVLGGLDSNARSKATFVTDGGVEATVLQHGLEGVEDFGDHLETLGERLGANRGDHEFLEVNRSGGVSTAVDHVAHRARERELGRAMELGDVLVERKASVLSGSNANSHGNAEDGVCTEGVLEHAVAVESDHGVVDFGLLGRIHADNLLGNLGVHVLDSSLRALAAVSLLVAVAEFASFAFTGGSAARNSSVTNDTVVKSYIDLERRIATGIQNLTSPNFSDFSHFVNLLLG